MLLMYVMCFLYMKTFSVCGIWEEELQSFVALAPVLFICGIFLRSKHTGPSFLIITSTCESN